MHPSITKYIVLSQYSKNMYYFNRWSTFSAKGAFSSFQLYYRTLSPVEVMEDMEMTMGIATPKETCSKITNP
jgi:hypothetical protein